MISASHISNLLKSGGFVICSDRMHEGTLVQRNFGGKVRVSIQNDSDRRALELAEQAATYLHRLGVLAVQDGSTVLVFGRINVR